MDKTGKIYQKTKTSSIKHEKPQRHSPSKRIGKTG
jgi:hypothetical protein